MDTGISGLTDIWTIYRIFIIIGFISSFLKFLLVFYFSFFLFHHHRLIVYRIGLMLAHMQFSVQFV